MSGRSAYARKKATERTPARARSNASSDNATTGGLGELVGGPVPRQDRARYREMDAAGTKTANARPRDLTGLPEMDDMAVYYNGDHNNGGRSGSSLGERSAGPHASRGNRPLDDSAHARPPRLTLKTDYVSGIEKSGLRNALDKKSDEVRKGLAKAFTFKKKERTGEDSQTAGDHRPESAATVRPVEVVDSRLEDPRDTREDAISPGRYREVLGDVDLRLSQAGMPVHSPPARPLPAVPGAVLPIKRWIGAGRPPQRWNKLRKDPELWDPHGDVLVFLGQRGQPSLDPSFRLSSHIIEATESRYLIAMLREGSTEDDLDTPSPLSGAPPMLQRHGSSGRRRLAPGGYGHRGQPTPPASEDNSLWNADGQISYELHFPAPSDSSARDQVRYHITTRNVFALLYHASLVGFSLYQALADLHDRLESYMPTTADNIGSILHYLSARGIDDVRGDPETAVGLLAWSEHRAVRWEEGWREAFVHCAGMYSELESCADFSHVSPLTRALLERASLETQLRIQAAEERLAAFEYGDMWPAAVAITASTSGPVVAAPAKAAMDRLQQFFVRYYTREFGSWPPLSSQSAVAAAPKVVGGRAEDTWLTRTVAQRLQKDFAALYDYLVNRDIIWDESEARPSRKWMMISESGNRGFEADTPDLPMTDMLVEFDNKHRFPHIPHPYPLVPESIPSLPVISTAGSGSSTSGIFGVKPSKNNTVPAQGGDGSGRVGAAERRIQLAYTEATNVFTLGTTFSHSTLVDAFSKFEKADCIGEVDPSTARRGRWVLIYGVLQTLATVSVDAPNVRYKDGVAYHLSPRLKGVKIPPWKTGAAGPDPHEATHEQSHCWTVPASWTNPTSPGGETDPSGSGADSSAEEGASYPTHFPQRGYSRQSNRGHQRQQQPHFLSPRTLLPTRGSLRSISTGVTAMTTTTTTTTATTTTGSNSVPSVVMGSPTAAGGLYTGFRSSVLSYAGSDTGSSGSGNGATHPVQTRIAPAPGPGQGQGQGWQAAAASRHVLHGDEHEWTSAAAAAASSRQTRGRQHGQGEAYPGSPSAAGGHAYARVSAGRMAALPGSRPRGAEEAGGADEGSASASASTSGYTHGPPAQDAGLGVELGELDELLDEVVDVDGEMFVMAHGTPRQAQAGWGDGGGGAGAEGEPDGPGGGSGAEMARVGPGPVIRDFDELESALGSMD